MNNEAKKLTEAIANLLEKHRLDNHIEAMLQVVPFDDLLLAFSNVCVFYALDNTKHDGKEYKEWFGRAEVFLNALKDRRKASSLQRKINSTMREMAEKNIETPPPLNVPRTDSGNVDLVTEGMY